MESRALDSLSLDSDLVARDTTWKTDWAPVTRTAPLHSRSRAGIADTVPINSWQGSEKAQLASIYRSSSSASARTTAGTHLTASREAGAPKSSFTELLARESTLRSSSGSCAMSTSSRLDAIGGAGPGPSVPQVSPASSSSSSLDSLDNLDQGSFMEGVSPRITARHRQAAASPSRTRQTLPHIYQQRAEEPSTADQEWGVGLDNLGNTCFANAVLQCLAAIPQLQTHSLQHLQAHPDGLEGPGDQAKARWADSFAELLCALQATAAGSSLSPDRFIERAAACDEAWGDGKQSDAQEFLRSLLDALHSVHKRPSSPLPKRLLPSRSTELQALQAWQAERASHSSIVSDLFEGQLQSTLRCSTCHDTSHNYEVFQDLSLPLLPRAELSIEDCLKGFTASEELEGEEAHRCDRCKVLRPATKALRIARLPPVLVLHLKRFSLADPTNYLSALEKDTASVSIREDGLDLAPYCTAAAAKAAGTCIYDLFGVVCHFGSLEGGHYTACTCDLHQGQGRGSWVHYNDALVEQAGQSVQAYSSAYLLFYRQRKELPWLPRGG